MHTQQVERARAASPVQTAEPIDVLHGAADAAGTLRHGRGDHRYVRIGPLDAAVRRCQQTGVGGRVGRAAPLIRQVELVEDFNVLDGALPVADRFVQVGLEIARV